MLTAAFADALGVSEDEARAMLLDFARRVREQTQIGPVEISGLGTFEQRDGHLAFAPDDSLALIVNHVYADLRPLPMHGATLPQRPPEPQPQPPAPAPAPSPEPPAPLAPEPEPPVPAPTPEPTPPLPPTPEPPARDEDEVTGPLDELPMPPLFATDDTLSALRDASRDLDPHAHQWADDLIREENDESEPLEEPQREEDTSSFAFADDEPDAFEPQRFDDDDDGEYLDDELPSFSPAFDDSPEPEMPRASEPPEIAIPEPDVPEPAYAAPTPEPFAPVEPGLANEPEATVDEELVAPAEDVLSDDDLIARIAPTPSQDVPPIAPPPEQEPPRRPPPSPRRKSNLPLIGVVVLALLLSIAGMMWWLTRSTAPDPIIAETPADTVQQVAPVDTLAAVPDEPETPLRGSTPVSVPPGYTVVIGSGATEAEAEALAAPYRELGYRTGILAGTSRGRRLYRVGVGQFETLQDAIAARDGALREGDLRTLTPSDAFTFPFQ